MPIDDRYHCDCGYIVYDDWNYCPCCGKPTGNDTEWEDNDGYYDEP